MLGKGGGVWGVDTTRMRIGHGHLSHVIVTEVRNKPS